MKMGMMGNVWDISLSENWQDVLCIGCGMGRKDMISNLAWVMVKMQLPLTEMGKTIWGAGLKGISETQLGHIHLKWFVDIHMESLSSQPFLRFWIQGWSSLTCYICESIALRQYFFLIKYWQYKEMRIMEYKEWKRKWLKAI